ncbi:MAG: NAD-dependent epimerase/dehydratase family protein [Bacillota bacterium]
MRVLVTGADGFVGRHLVRELRERGHIVRAAVRPGSDAPWTAAAGVTAVPFELTDADSVQAALSVPCDAVVHLAAMASSAEARRDPGGAWIINAAGTARVAEAAASLRETGAADPKLLVVSTGEVYGEAHRPLREDDELKPQSPYAASKVGAEIAALEVARRTGLAVMVARPFTHTGPGQRDVFFVPALLGRLRAARQTGARTVRVGNLAPVRDLSDVRDIARAYGLLIERGEPGETYNVSRGEGVALTDLFAQMAAAVGVDAQPEPDPTLMRRADLPYLVGDSTKLRRATGWTPAISMDQTLRDMLDAETY